MIERLLGEDVSCDHDGHELFLFFKSLMDNPADDMHVGGKREGICPLRIYYNLAKSVAHPLVPRHCP